MGNKKDNKNFKEQNTNNFEKTNKIKNSYSNSNGNSSQKQNLNTIKPYKKANTNPNNNQVNNKLQHQKANEYKTNNYNKNPNNNINKNSNLNKNGNSNKNNNANQKNNTNRSNGINQNSNSSKNRNINSNPNKNINQNNNINSNKNGNKNTNIKSTNNTNQNRNTNQKNSLNSNNGTKNYDKNSNKQKSNSYKFKNENNTNSIKKQHKGNDKKPENKDKNIETTKTVEKTKEVNNNNIDTEKTNKSKTPIIISLVIIAIILIIITMFFINFAGNKISNNVSIENIDVSKLTYIEAKNKIENECKDILENGKVVYTYNDSEYEINLDDINFSYLIDDSLSKAMNITRSSNIFEAVKDYYGLKFGNKKNVDLEFKYDQKKLNQEIKKIEDNFYQEVKQYSYTVDDNKVKITNGDIGIRILYDEFEESFKNAIENKNIENNIEIPIYIEEPEQIDIAKIHKEIYVEMKNASYTTDPFEIHNEVRGVNFDVSLLNEMIKSEPEKEAYEIDLVYTEPEIKVGDLDLYNDILGRCSTAYVNNPNRTTNLRLAASKIDGMILMPGETFSYNEVVGERTISAGYKNAAIYINGEVEDGLAGGICQISSTLYDAVVYANLEVTERYNHARVPSYLSAGKDATVYWGSKDFKFKNNRSYPIKISITVNGGYATAIIHGKKTDNEYDISFETSIVGRSNGYMRVNTYKVYKQNGAVIKREYLYTDSYKV